MTRTVLESLMIALWIGMASAGAARAEDAEGPEATVEAMVDEALSVLRDPEMQKPGMRDKRRQKLRDIASEVFDWQQMARRSLGVHWRDLDETQREAFVGLYEELIARQWLDDIDQFQGSERVSIDETSRDGDTATVETTIITHSREHVPVDYHLRRKGEQWRVHDVAIEGVSMVRHYRQTLHRFLVNGTFEQLMDKLRRRLGREE